MPKRVRWLPIAVALGVVLLVIGATRTAPRQTNRTPVLETVPALPDTVAQVNKYFETAWAAQHIQPAAPAPELQIYRRLALALLGTIPSLEELRQFEADQQPQRLERWTQRILNDSRFGYYFSERLARSLVGTDDGQFLIFRRDRFKNWLRENLHKKTPYDQLVRHMIADTGLWTSVPATNFISSAFANDDIDENKLAGRSVRAFLGQRIDCAQCHDHPFDHWKQAEFQGLAAYFGQVRTSLVGMQDFSNVDYKVENRKTKVEEIIAPAVPFHPEWLPKSGSRREQLAAWITHPENRRFERATANRIWGLMFGKGYIDPIDGLPDPPQDQTDLLDILGADFRQHNYDLRRLIQVIAASKPYRLNSTHPTEDEQQVEELKSQWAVFPLIRLRPEQVIGSILQASTLGTVDQNSHLLFRTIRFFRENDFVKEYGDLGENELTEQPGTIPQALQRMNSNLIRELTEANAVSSAGRIFGMSPDDATCIETAYLVALTRRPTAPEIDYFTHQLQAAAKNERAKVVEDMIWSLCNSQEFSWNH
jgi:hypothetical protein